MAKNKKKKSTQTKLPPMPTKPVAPTHVPRGKLTPGDKRFIGRQRGQLAEARRAGEEAASAQIRGISANLGRQGKKLSKESAKILGSMDRHVKQVKQENRQTRRDVRAGQAEIMGRTGAQGARGTWMEAGLTGARQRQAAGQAKVSGQVAGALQKQGQGVARAGKQAIQEYKAVEKTGTKNSMSILEVLAAERQSDDQRFLSEMRFNMRQQRQQEQFQLMMANLGFEQDIYKLELQNRLQAEYLEWQHDNGFLLKPEEQAALDWKYKEMELSEAWKKARNDQDKKSAAKFEAYTTATEDAVVRTAQMLATPGEFKAWQASAAQSAQNNGTDVTTALVDLLVPADSVSQAVDPVVVKSAVRQMITDRMNGDMTPERYESGGGAGYAPSSKDILGWIRQAEATDNSMMQYMNRKGSVLEQAASDYQQLSIAASFVEGAKATKFANKAAAHFAEKGIPEEVYGSSVEGTAKAISGDGIGSGLATLGTTAAATVGGVAASNLRAGLKGVSEITDSINSVNVSQEDMFKLRQWTKAAGAAQKAAAQAGRVSMFGTPDLNPETRVGSGSSASGVFMDELAARDFASGKINAAQYTKILQGLASGVAKTDKGGVSLGFSPLRQLLTGDKEGYLSDPMKALEDQSEAIEAESDQPWYKQTLAWDLHELLPGI